MVFSRLYRFSTNTLDMVAVKTNFLAFSENLLQFTNVTAVLKTYFHKCVQLFNFFINSYMLLVCMNALFKRSGKRQNDAAGTSFLICGNRRILSEAYMKERLGTERNRQRRLPSTSKIPLRKRTPTAET